MTTKKIAAAQQTQGIQRFFNFLTVKDGILSNGSAELIQYFKNGNVPEEANALYDQMGSNPEITITDAETIKELYKYLGMVKVDGETNESITDCYHYVQFKLSDEHYIYYSFEGENIWSYGGKNYSISNSGKLFGLIKELTNED